MESDLDDEYKKRQFLSALKTGKVPKRAGLGKRLYLLGGYNDNLSYCTKDTYHNIMCPTLTNRLCYSKYVYGSAQSVIIDRLYSENMKHVFNKYLGEHHLEPHWCYIFIYYNESNVVPWSVLDNDLKIMYPNNYREDKNGFIHYK